MSVALHLDAALESPYGMSAFVALKEKGVPFAVHGVDLDRAEQREPEFARRSLTARIPALDHDGFWLSESMAIVEYVDEGFEGPPLLPAGLRERARARQVMGWLRSDLVALRNERPTSSIFGGPPATSALSPAAEVAAAKLLSVTAALLRPGADALFDRFTVADVDLALALHRMVVNGDPMPAATARWARAVFDRPSVRAFATLPRPAR